MTEVFKSIDQNYYKAIDDFNLLHEGVLFDFSSLWISFKEESQGNLYNFLLSDWHVHPIIRFFSLTHQLLYAKISLLFYFSRDVYVFYKLKFILLFFLPFNLIFFFLKWSMFVFFCFHYYLLLIYNCLCEFFAFLFSLFFVKYLINFFSQISINYIILKFSFIFSIFRDRKSVV